MDELVKLVAKKVKIPEAQAKVAVETVLKFLKDKLPAPIAGQIDAVINGGQAADVMGKAGDMLGGLLGGKKKK